MQRALRVGLLLLSMGFMPVGWTAERVALVIGNGGYTELQALANPRNDATAMAQALKGLGYRLVGREGQPADGPLVDLDQEGLLEATDAFARAASGQEIAFLYYAGHGFQDGASSYLVPVDAPKPRKNIEILKGRSVPLDRVIRGLDGKAQMVVAVFDACREIPELEAMAGQSRGGGLSGEGGSYRGLLRVEGTSPSGRLIAYAGAAGQLVKDGAGNHSPYTQLLLDRLGVAVTEKKNVELTIFFQQVAWDFRDHQEGQRPLLEISAKPSTFYLLPGPVAIVPPPLPPPPVVSSPPVVEPPKPLKLEPPPSPPAIGREAVWNPPEGKWETVNSECDDMTCIASEMKRAGASSQAIAFTELMHKVNDDTVYMNLFKEMGTVDVAEVTGPVLNDPATSYFILVNGIPRIIELLDKARNVDLKKDRHYQSFSKKFPKIMLWASHHDFEKMESLPQGGQRFIFKFLMLNGCHACEIAGWARIAFDFDQSGRLAATNLIGLIEE